MKFGIIILLLIFKPIVFKADCSPKFSETFELQFIDSNSKKIKVDSFIIISDLNYKFDTASFPIDKCLNPTEKFWMGVTIINLYNSYEIFTHSFISKFSLIIYLNNQSYKLSDINNYPGCKLYTFEIKKSILNKSNIINNYWLIYLISILFTLFIEICIFAIYNRKNNYSIPFRAILCLNVLTHFSLWFIYSHTYLSIILIEIIVIIIECLFWKYYFKNSKVNLSYCLKLSIYSNVVSWFLGFFFQL